MVNNLSLLLALVSKARFLGRVLAILLPQIPNSPYSPSPKIYFTHKRWFWHSGDLCSRSLKHHLPDTHMGEEEKKKRQINKKVTVWLSWGLEREMQSTGSEFEGIGGSITKYKYTLSGEIVWEAMEEWGEERRQRFLWYLPVWHQLQVVFK